MVSEANIFGYCKIIMLIIKLISAMSSHVINITKLIIILGDYALLIK